MTDDRSMDKREDTLTDDEMDGVTGGCVNEVARNAGYSGPSSNICLEGMSLSPVNTGSDLEGPNKSNTPPSLFPQNCG